MAGNRNGITVRHSRSCRELQGGKCSCSPTYRARVLDADGVRHTKSSKSRAEVEAWLRDSRRKRKSGQPVQTPQRTVGTALAELREELEAGTGMTRTGDDYKPSVRVSYLQSIDRWLVNARAPRGRLVQVPVADLSTAHVQRLVADLRADGKSPSTIRNILMPLRVLVRRERLLGTLDRDPFPSGILPTGSGRRERFADRHEVDRLLDALDFPERAFFALAFYAGLRRGEISALRWRNIDTTTRRVWVRRSFDLHSRQITPPKSAEGRREIPLAPPLEAILDEFCATVAAEKGAEAIAPDALIFPGPRSGRPLGGDVVTRWARKRWRERDLTPIGLHEARHTFASLQIAMGTPGKQLQSYMGHASLTITMDRYGHLYPVDMSVEADKWGEFLTAHRDEPTA